MKPPVETIRLSNSAHDRLVQLRRATGIEHWNILCRWALCLSLAERDEIPPLLRSDRSNVEMSWNTFAGQWSDVLISLVSVRWREAVKTNPQLSLADYFYMMLEFGITILPKAISKSDQRNLCALPALERI